MLFKLSSVAAYKGRNDDAEKHASAMASPQRGVRGAERLRACRLWQRVPLSEATKTAEQHFRQAVDASVRAGASRAEARARPALGALLMRVGSVTDALAQAKATFDYYDQTALSRNARGH